MCFLRHFVCDLHTDDSNPNFLSVKKNVSIMRRIKFFGNILFPTSQKNSSFKRGSFHLHSQLFFSKIWSLHIQLVRCQIIFICNNKNYFFKKIFGRTLILPEESLISTDSAHIDPECIPTNVSHPYPDLSIFFDHPLFDKSLKAYSALASKHYTYS